MTTRDPYPQNDLHITPSSLIGGILLVIGIAYLIISGHVGSTGVFLAGTSVTVIGLLGIVGDIHWIRGF